LEEKYRILIAEDQRIVREGLRSLILSSGQFEVIGEAGDGRQTLELTARLNPDLVLLDISMPRMDGLSAIREIKTCAPKTRVLVLTVHKEEEHIVEALKSGADGYALKDSSHAELMVAIKTVIEGNRYICPGISGKVIEGYLSGRVGLTLISPWMTLTRREREVLKLIGEGYKCRDIASYLYISPKTVEKHRSNIIRKLDIRTAAELVAYARKKGLVVT
jgi:DNA-binding NarL/FixJ family response regulator